MTPRARATDHPIIFDAAGVRLILAGEKTATRRLVRGPEAHRYETATPAEQRWLRDRWLSVCRYGRVGDRLWVQEPFFDCRCERPARDLGILYAADCPPGTPLGFPGGWRTPRFMPRELARLRLVVTGLRVERLHRLTTAGAWAEGCESIAEYRAQWATHNGKRVPWSSNPPVYVIEFARVGAQED